MANPSSALLEAAKQSKYQVGGDPSDHIVFKGARLKALRRQYNVTQSSLAQLIGLSRPMIIALEQERSNPSLSTLCKLAYHFGVTTDWLLGMDEYQEEAD